MAQLWGGRFTKETDQLVYNFNASISFDKRFYKQDIRGSIAHVTMLEKQGILTKEEKDQIIEGLESICRDVENKTLEITEEYHQKAASETVHLEGVDFSELRMLDHGVFLQGLFHLVGQRRALGGKLPLAVHRRQDLGGLAQRRDGHEVRRHEESEGRGVVRRAERRDDEVNYSFIVMNSWLSAFLKEGEFQ